MSAVATFANPNVLEFYRTLPFNIRESVDESVEAIHRTDHANSYPMLGPLLRPGVRVLDVGCGTGWFSNSLAYHHHTLSTGLDFNPVAVERARAVTAELKLPTRFDVGDLFLYEPAEPFDLVVSLGVLHHTDNCAAAVRRVCEKFVKPGGHVLIGLYHTHGRKPFLDHFEAMKQRGASEQEMLDEYRRLHAQLKDETLLVSWFRDQVLHPHETQHTLEEMYPILQEMGMELLFTSINRFQPITSLNALFEEEKKYYDVGVQRLEQGQYFTGFFVFLARKGAAPASAPAKGPQASMEDSLMDSKPYVEHHSTFGYSYIPNVNMELPRPGGGHYRMVTNSRGVRSDREYAFKKPPGVYRIIVCGDSMAAGQFTSNDQRFTELLERRVPGLEVLNLALEGTGTDQQLLIYENIGALYEHDAVVVMPFLQNIRRNMVAARVSIDPKTLAKVLAPKPRFELKNGQLELLNVPVPKERKPVVEGDEASLNGTDSDLSIARKIKNSLNRMPGIGLAKKILYQVSPWEPFPEYKSADTKEWQLMAAILKRFKASAGARPVVIIPAFYDSYVRYRMARNYWNRFSELGQIPGIQVWDLLPHFRQLGPEASRGFLEPYDCHFSAYGHLVLTEFLEQKLKEAGLFPTNRAGATRAFEKQRDRK